MKNYIDECREQYEVDHRQDPVLTKYTFALYALYPAVEKLFEDGKDIVTTSFRMAGLYPWNKEEPKKRNRLAVGDAAVQASSSTPVPGTDQVDTIVTNTNSALNEVGISLKRGDSPDS